MSLAFVQHQKGRPPPNPAQIQKMLDENSQLIQAIADYQNKGKATECLQYQQILHRNLVYLASIADSNQNISSLLPPPQGVPAGGQPHMQQQVNPMSQTDGPTNMQPHQGMPPTQTMPPSNMQHGTHPMSGYNQGQNPQSQPHMGGYNRPMVMQQPPQGMAPQQYGGATGGHMYPQSQQQPMMGQQGSLGKYLVVNGGQYRPQQGNYPAQGGPQQPPAQYGPNQPTPYSGQNPAPPPPPQVRSPMYL